MASLKGATLSRADPISESLLQLRRDASFRFDSLSGWSEHAVRPGQSDDITLIIQNSA
jgi:hypothetical protein